MLHRVHQLLFNLHGRASWSNAQSRLLLFATLCLGDYALGILSKDIPQSTLDEVRAWGYADDEEAFTNILIFTDGSGTMTNTWSSHR